MKVCSLQIIFQPDRDELLFRKQNFSTALNIHHEEDKTAGL